MIQTLKTVKEYKESLIAPAIRANALYEGQYLLGTSMARPENRASSAEWTGLVAQRYHCSPPWKPVRAYSAA